jgi:hypothetical protein
MSDRDSTADDQPGVFGNLPRTRPAHRSPRRHAGDGPPATADAERDRPRLQPRPRARRAPDRADDPLEPPAEAAPEEDRIGNLEDLAWAGIAVAAEAATLGVRLAGRAYEAARDAVERR